MSMVIRIISLVKSRDLDALPKPESKLMSLVTQAVSLFNSTDLDSLPNPLSKLISLISQKFSMNSDQKPESDLNFSSLFEEIFYHKPYPELISLIFLIFSVVISTNTELEDLTSIFGQVEGYFYQGKFCVTYDGSRDLESTLISLISELLDHCQSYSNSESKIMSMVIRIIYLIKSRDLDSLPKPESKLMSLITQTVSLFNSMDLDSLPKPLCKLISFISQKISSDSDQRPESDLNFKSLVDETLKLKPEPELVSGIRQIVSVVVAISKKCQTLEPILLVPQVQVDFLEGNFCVEPLWIDGNRDTWRCFVGDWNLISSTRDDYFTHFRCGSCNGEHHNEYEKAPIKIKHPLHQKHSLQLALKTSSRWGSRGKTRECYCCDDDLEEVFYFCSACDFSMNVACPEKTPDLYIPHSKWHHHPLALFPLKTSLTCDICALAHSNSPIYICPPCAFVAHLKCTNLPRVIRISRHPYHRLCHTPSFEEGDWYCGVCRRTIHNDYGGYSCVRDGCAYAAHSRCATQSNVWDGIDLEGEPEEIEEEVADPFVKIRNGIIRHFLHDHHHLRLDENTCRDYDDNKLCQACVTPIYFGNFYSCVQCEFVLHEMCAHLSRKIYHPIHPHPFTLAILRDVMDFEIKCAACDWSLSTAGFFYECSKEECHFRLHVQCATISEPLVHVNHVHPLFLTSKPGEKRICFVCGRVGGFFGANETFNCIDGCDHYALCFRCATLPQKLRYKHDKHILTLSYKETNTVTYWCEACEGKIKPEEGFYMCNEYCCVTLHVKCLIGKDLYMKPGSSFFYAASYNGPEQVSVQSNNHHMSRSICSRSTCKKRCPHKVVFHCSGSIVCSIKCMESFFLFKYG